MTRSRVFRRRVFDGAPHQQAAPGRRNLRLICDVRNIPRQPSHASGGCQPQHGSEPSPLVTMLLVWPLSAQAQSSPQPAGAFLDASVQAVAASLASPLQREVVIGRGPYLYWNSVPSQDPPGGGDTYTAVVGDVLTFRYNHDNNVYLMATESDWESCTNFDSGTQVGTHIMNNAPSDYSDVGLTNVYQAVVLQPGMLYFSCQRGRQATCDHCHFGQKIKVSVSLGRPSTSPPAPPLACNLVDNCECSCCNAAECPGFPASQRVYVQLKFNAASAESCNAAACSSRFARYAA